MIFFSFLSDKIILSETSFVYFRQRVRKQPKQLKTNNFLCFHFPITAEVSPPPAVSSLLHSAARHFSIQQRYLYPNRLSILFYKTVYESWNRFVHLRLSRSIYVEYPAPETALVRLQTNLPYFPNKKSHAKTLFSHSSNYLYSRNDNITNTPIILAKNIITYFI